MKLDEVEDINGNHTQHTQHKTLFPRDAKSELAHSPNGGGAGDHDPFAKQSDGETDGRVSRAH